MVWQPRGLLGQTQHENANSLPAITVLALVTVVHKTCAMFTHLTPKQADDNRPQVPKLCMHLCIPHDRKLGSNCHSSAAQQRTANPWHVFIDYDYDYDYIMAPQRGRPYGANLGSMGRNTGTWSIRSECLSNITSWSRRKGIENTTLPFIPE